jgi:large subunit ribosomal protein L10
LSYDDPVAPAKVLTQFAKDHDKPEIKMGVLNGKVIGVPEIRALSDLPSREVLLAKLLSVMAAVPTSFVRVLNNIPVGLLNVMQALKEKKEATAGE